MKNKKTTLLTVIILLHIQIAFSQNKTEVIYPVSFGVSKPLSELFNTNSIQSDEEKIKAFKARYNEKIPTQTKTLEDNSAYYNDINTIQNTNGTRTLSSPIANFDGITPYSSGGFSVVPDPTGASGPNHYVQSINVTDFAVYDKTTGTQIGFTKDLASLWGGSKNNVGDPIVLYDKYADRWIISEMGSSVGSNGYELLFAVSTSPDPTGTYYTYSYPTALLPDYQKMAIWSDGYYINIDEYVSNSSSIYVAERNAMLAGNPTAKLLTHKYTYVHGMPCPFWYALPADADGMLPPAGLKCPLFSYTDDSWGNGATDAIEIRYVTTNWSGTPSISVNSPATIPVGTFDASYGCWSTSLITQSDGISQLAGVAGGLMYRAQWKKWTGYNSVVLNWMVKISSTQNSIKWVELRQDQTTLQWSLFQEGIYAPDALNRWMGSISMDDEGNIGLCYAVTGPTPIATSPSLRYTGRLKNDPLGQMTFAEKTAVAGSGVLTNSGQRFGDYTHTSMDPDGYTFWHTGEYVLNNNAKTRIYSFQLSNSIGVQEQNNSIEWITYQENGMFNSSISKLPNNNALTITLFNILGEVISEKSITPSANKTETSFDISSLAKGSYLIRIGNADFQKVKKVILN